MRRPFIAGNWKLNKTPSEARALARALRDTLDDAWTAAVDVAVAPPAVSLSAVAQVLTDSPIRLAGQSLFWEASGAFTGEISAPMLEDVGCQHVIIGHSERRQLFGETDETVARRVEAALASTLNPIVCVGETLEQREADETFDVVERQLAAALEPVTADQASRVTIAYEPVWAIGTGRTASPEQAQEVHAFLRDVLARRLGEGAAAAMRIQYGGSVKPANAADLLAQPDIDGALVGGASLKAADFAAIVAAGAAQR